MTPPPSSQQLIVLFDGVCGLCTKSVQLIIRWDRSGLFRFASLQSEIGMRLAARHGIAADALETLVLLEGDEASVSSDAVLAIASHLGGLWRLVSVLRTLPHGVRDRIYRFVARHRYRWFGRRTACWIPPGGLEDRFL